MADCTHCRNGWLGLGDMECVNGVFIDIDVATEGWQSDVAYPPAPCCACPMCGGKGCRSCDDTGWRSGKDESIERLAEWTNLAGDRTNG